MSETTASLAASITKKSSAQTYYTIRFMADHDLIGDAYRTYAYFRWWMITSTPCRFHSLNETPSSNVRKPYRGCCYRGEQASDVCQEEQMLVDLGNSDPDRKAVCIAIFTT